MDKCLTQSHAPANVKDHKSAATVFKFITKTLVHVSAPIQILATTIFRHLTQTPVNASALTNQLATVSRHSTQILVNVNASTNLLVTVSSSLT
jgi:hypothetical protein